MSNYKPTFITSDWHIGHSNSIKFDNRPFKDLEDMHSSLIKRYNSTVPEKGICYFLGDIGNKTEDIKKVITQLNGTKVLILGNHDKGINTMYNCGFDVVIYNATIYIGDNKVTMSHCPLVGIPREDITGMRGSDGAENWHGESRLKHRMSSVKDEGQFHLHGHIHSRVGKTSSKTKLGRQLDVGVCAHNYTPVSLSYIESWIAQTLKEGG